MKSLLISSMYFPPHTGGISHFVGSIASVLGPDRVCCLTGVPGSPGAVETRLGPRVYRRPAAFEGAKYRQGLVWGAAIAQIMLRERPVAIQLGLVSDGSMGLWLRRWLRLPFVVYAYGNEILTAMQSAWQKPRLALQHADRVLAISRFTADLVRRAGVSPERIALVHPGCDVDRFRPRPARMDLRHALLGPRDRDRVLLTVGGLVARKGQDMVIRALPRLRQSIPDVTYLIVGDGPYRAQLEALAMSVGVRDHVVFAGMVSAEDLPDVYALSDVYVMPSREQLESCDVEGFGLVFLEANACGKAVVGGRSGGIPDAVEDGVSGLLVDPHDPEDIANALRRILSDGDMALRLGEQGRLRVVREFEWKRIGDQVQGILDSIQRERPGFRG